MSREDEINVELFFNLIQLKNNLGEILENCNSQLELMEEFPTEFKKKIPLVQKEITSTKKEIKQTEKDIKELLFEINVEVLDKIIQKSEPEYINDLLDIRCQKTQ